MAKRKTYLLIGGLAILLLACSITSGTLSAAQIKPALTASPPPSTVPTIADPTPSPERCTVTADLLNFRACAGTACEVLAVLDAGDLLTVLERGDWLNVQLSDGRIGWVNSNFTQMEK